MVLLVSASTMMAAPDVSGVWNLDFDPDFSGHRGTGQCTFKQADKKLTGNCGTDSPNPTAISGEVNGQKVVFRFKTGTKNEITATFTADLDDQARTMKGTWHFIDGEKKEREGRFEARKRD
jgi:hypothetical protein